ncbi:lipoyltransferase [Janibacter sp. HTCC2649]|uniref:hypothetical protein n=1 Tax=Janibacter sp. HTCC2649 TaxID=313589 RepID=UPI000066E980|nr:hypothetical protein [Janibacter sp. HTCC2649]EAP98750.1 lipoyltransferase [Janibacter sp. HTCC2649]
MRRLIVVGTVALLTGCGSSVASPRPATSSQTPTAEISCGEVELGQGEVLEVGGAKERACFEGALREGRAATLAVSQPTIEGDPIVTTWRLATDRTLTGDIDSSKDRFGNQAHTLVSCGRITQLPDPLRCAQSG